MSTCMRGLALGGVALAVLLAGPWPGRASADGPPVPPPPPPPASAPEDVTKGTPPAVEHVATSDEEAAGAPKTPPSDAPAAPAAGADGAPSEAAPSEEPKAEPPKPEAPKPAEPAAEEAKPEETPPAVPKKDETWARDMPPPPPPLWRGEVTVRGRGRYSADLDEHDTDLYEYLLLKFRDELAPGWSGSLHLRVAQDLDGETDDGGFVFDSIDDTYDSRVTARLYHLYANYRPVSGLVQEARLGRQYVEAGDLLLMDGLRVTSRPTCNCPSWTFQAFAGLPAHLFESGPDGDFMGGVGVKAFPSPFTEVTLNYAYIQDENDFYGTPDANLVTLDLYQRVSRNLRLRGRYQQVDEDIRSVEASFDAWTNAGDASIRGVFRTQPSTIDSLVYDLDAYYAIEQTLYPYWQAGLSASKELSRCFILDGGVQGRALYDADDQGTYNREWARFYATLSTWRWPASTLGLALTGEWYTGDDDVGAFSFEAEWDPSPCWSVRFGTDYQLWRTDIYADTDRYDSQVYFLRAIWKPSPRWRVDVKFEYEHDDIDDFFEINALVRYEW